jgi:hypothetical protein
VDRARDGIPNLSQSKAGEPVVDLHLHSTASDGECPPEEVVARAAGAGLEAIALTDHDTLDGVPAAVAAGLRYGVRVVSGCEFSVAAPWGEMHVLGYFLPVADPGLLQFLRDRRDDRVRRGREIVDRLKVMGLELELDDVLNEAAGGALGRPHVARALVRRGHAVDLDDAFDRYVGRAKPGFVEKRLPAFAEVATLVHRVGGLVSAAHLKDRGTRAVLRNLKEQGLDAVETRHPSHDVDTRARLTDHALALGLLRTGGSDWHGDGTPQAGLGSQGVPAEWLARLDAARSGSPEPAGTAPN